MNFSLKKSYDVIVIGTGPAGCMAAKHAALNGARVLIIDKKKSVGDPIQCAGFIPDSNELKHLIPSMRLPEEAVYIPDRIVLQKTKKQRIYAPDMKQKEFDVNGCVLDRRLYDEYLSERAADSGAELHCSTKAVRFSVPSDPNKDVTVHIKQNENKEIFEIKASVVIGADGPVSVVARSVPCFLSYGKDNSLKNTGIPYERGLGYAYKMTGTDTDFETLEMFFGNDYVPGGYSWIFPEGKNKVCVGVGVRRSLMKEPLSAKYYLDKFIKMHPVGAQKLKGGKITQKISGIIPVDGAPNSTVSNKFMITGDAAGHVMATNGGGIPFAMTGGMIAGSVAGAYISGACESLYIYEKLWKQSFGSVLESSVRARCMMDKFLSSDKLINAAFHIIPAGQFKKMQCGYMPSFIKKSAYFLSKK